MFKAITHWFSPLTVEVEDGQWNAYGYPGLRQMWLFELLKLQGGVSDSVPEGTYHYNAWRITPWKLYVRLTPTK